MHRETPVRPGRPRRCGGPFRFWACASNFCVALTLMPGDQPEKFYIILKGQVNILIPRSQEEIQKDVLEQEIHSKGWTNQEKAQSAVERISHYSEKLQRLKLLRNRLNCGVVNASSQRKLPEGLAKGERSSKTLTDKAMGVGQPVGQPGGQAGDRLSAAQGEPSDQRSPPKRQSKEMGKPVLPADSPVSAQRKFTKLSSDDSEAQSPLPVRAGQGAE